MFGKDGSLIKTGLRSLIMVMSVILAFTTVSEANWKGFDDYFPGLTDKDMEIAGNAARIDLTDKPIGTTLSWENTESGNSGTVQLINLYEWKGKPCRKLIHNLNLANKKIQGWKVGVCLIDDQWKWPEPPERIY